MSQHYRRACCCGGSGPNGFGQCCYPTTNMRLRMSTVFINAATLNGQDIAKDEISFQIDAVLVPVTQGGIVTRMRSISGTAQGRYVSERMCTNDTPQVGTTCSPAQPADCPPCTAYRLDYRDTITMMTTSVTDAASLFCQAFCADNRRTNTLVWAVNGPATLVRVIGNCTGVETTETLDTEWGFGHTAYGRGGCLDDSTFSSAYIPLAAAPQHYCSGVCTPWAPNVQECGDGARMFTEIFSEQICAAQDWPPAGGFATLNAHTCPTTGCTRTPFECVNVDCFGNPIVSYRCGCDNNLPYANLGLHYSVGWGNSAMGSVAFRCQQASSVSISNA